MASWRMGVWLRMMAAAGLAGCSDGGSGGVLVPPPTFDEQFTRAETLFAEADARANTDPAALPTSGSAVYEGVMYLDPGFLGEAGDDSDDLVGDLRMAADFEDDTVTGRIDDFVTFEDERYGGALVLSDGTFDRAADPSSEDVFDADLGGALTAPDGTRYEVTGGMGGVFTGAGHQYVLGRVGGEACGGPAGCTDLDGGFVAVRD